MRVIWQTKMVKISIDENFSKSCPLFKGAALIANIKNSLYDEGLWQEINICTERCQKVFTAENIKEFPPVKYTRNAYRTFGKDPSRYRPSSESLIRRILQGKPLYQINTTVDLINLASMEFGYSIGGFDYSKINGGTIRLGVGEKGEPYVGIGRGEFNIENMPVYRDAIGGIGTPTSDNERTKLDLDTNMLLAIVNGYDGNESNIVKCAERIKELVQKYVSGDDCQIFTY